MSEHVYKVIEVVGTSPTSWEDAATNAVEMAGESIKDLRIAEVKGQDVRIEDGHIIEYRTRMNMSFKFHGELTHHVHA